MPTGYTAGVQDGTVTDFADFAMQCARAFGALILMRDDPQDAPIPDEFQPSDYNAKKLADASARLKMLRDTPDSELAKQFDANKLERRNYCEKGIVEKQEQIVRYESMLAKVNRWKPPTPEHEGLKRFMLEQLISSIDWDCGGTYYKDELAKIDSKTFENWKADQVDSCLRDIDYHTREHAEEIKRTQGRNNWVRQLRESLNGEAMTV